MKPSPVPGNALVSVPGDRRMAGFSHYLLASMIDARW
jgi:hypothetical protein